MTLPSASGPKLTPRTILAVWPYYDPLYEFWAMQELVDNGDAAPTWRENGPLGEYSNRYADRRVAIADAELRNERFFLDADIRVVDHVRRTSLKLKTEKALQAIRRLQDEEALMLKAALSRHVNDRRPSADGLRLMPNIENFRLELTQQLLKMPYLKIVKIGVPKGIYLPSILTVDSSGTWSGRVFSGSKPALIAERAKIANGFGFDLNDNWGQTKAKIRKLLLPRANALLQLASVRLLLAEALARGDRVLVSNGIVFWYEASGEIGWTVKQTTDASGDKGSSIWKEGEIISANHGRLIVLPYIKENGEYVHGYTKNAPNDGPALPRHTKEFVKIPFRLYDDDLMIGLLGELPYE